MIMFIMKGGFQKTAANASARKAVAKALSPKAHGREGVELGSSGQCTSSSWADEEGDEEEVGSMVDEEGDEEEVGSMADEEGDEEVGSMVDEDEFAAEEAAAAAAAREVRVVHFEVEFEAAFTNYRRLGETIDWMALSENWT